MWLLCFVSRRRRPALWKKEMSNIKYRTDLKSYGNSYCLSLVADAHFKPGNLKRALTLL